VDLYAQYRSVVVYMVLVAFALKFELLSIG